MIGVVHDYRDKGGSQYVLLADMEYLRIAGMPKICLEVDKNNDPAVRLYTSIGFKI